MRKFFFILCSLAMASAVVGLVRGIGAMVDGNWSALGDSDLLWIQWSNDIGIKRMLLSVPIALLLLKLVGQTRPLSLFQNWRATLICTSIALLPHLMAEIKVPDSSTKPSIVLITLDSVRLDFLGWGGSELPTSPKLDALAAKGVRFTQNISQSSWTKPSTATLLTGLVPSKHHANSRYGPLANSQRTLAEALSLDGYRTTCYSSNPNITPTFGFMQGFDFMHHDVASTATELIASGKQWLDSADKRASFLYLHLNDAHYPYEPSSEYAGMFNKTGIDAFLDGSAEIKFRNSFGETFSEGQVESLKLSYAEEIKYLDDVVGDFVNELLNSRDDIIVIITADHGEEFLEHGDLGHGHTVYDELIRIPLQFVASNKLMGENDWQIGVHQQQVRQMDVLPTILEMCSLGWPNEIRPLDGESLLPFFRETQGEHEHRQAISETDSQGSALSGMAGPLRSFRLPSSKLIIGDPWTEAISNRVWLFNLLADPRETNNLAQSDLDEVKSMRGKYDASGWLLPTFYNSSARVTMSENEKAQLAEMGYSDDGEDAAADYDPYFDPRAIPWVELKISSD